CWAKVNWLRRRVPSPVRVLAEIRLKRLGAANARSNPTIPNTTIISMSEKAFSPQCECFLIISNFVKGQLLDLFGTTPLGTTQHYQRAKHFMADSFLVEL